MEEKIHLQSPKPFSAGFRIPFKKPYTLTLQVSGIEYLKEIRRLSLYLPDVPDAPCSTRSILRQLEDDVVAQMIRKNPKWFHNDLSDADIRARFRSALQPDGHLWIRASPSHTPKTMAVNDRPIPDLDALSVSIGDMVFASVCLVCHGVYLQKSHYELLWKIETLQVHCLTDRDLQQSTDIDEYKDAIEAQCDDDLRQLNALLADEIAQWEKEAHRRQTQLSHLKTLLSQCQNYSTTHPEWNKTLEYIQVEIAQSKKKYYLSV